MRWILFAATLSAGALGAIGQGYAAAGPQTESSPVVPDTPAPSLPTMSPTGRTPATPAPSAGMGRRTNAAGSDAAQAAGRDSSTAAPGGQPESTANGSLSTTSPEDANSQRPVPPTTPEGNGVGTKSPKD